MSNPSAREPDRRALKILFDAYWTPAGWRDEKSRAIPPDDFEHAKAAGVMFDPVSLAHDEVVERALAAATQVDRRRVADAFVASLATRRLDRRSALGSFAVLRHFPRHPATPGSPTCSICGVPPGRSRPADLSVLNFERFKWGGVRHDDPLYAAFDLEQFAAAPDDRPVEADWAALRAIFAAIDSAPPKTTASALEKRLAKSFPSNKAEREVVIAILGYCGVLAVAAHPGYFHAFAPWSQRVDPRDTEMKYPACWWTRAAGINQPAVDHWFGHGL